MPESMSQCGPNEEEEGVDRPILEDGDLSQRKAPSSGARLWDRVRSRLLRPKVKKTALSYDASTDFSWSSSLSGAFESQPLVTLAKISIWAFEFPENTSTNKGLSGWDFFGATTSATLDGRSTQGIDQNDSYLISEQRLAASAPLGGHMDACLRVAG